MVTLQDFIHALETQNFLVKDNKTHTVKLTTVKVLFERQHQGSSSIDSKVKVEGEKLSSKGDYLWVPEDVIFVARFQSNCRISRIVLQDNAISEHELP